MKLFIGTDGQILTERQFRAVQADSLRLANIASLARNPTTVTPPWMLVRKDAR